MATVASPYTANPQRYCGGALPPRKARKKFERGIINVHGVLTRTEIALRFPRASCLFGRRRIVIECSGLKKLHSSSTDFLLLSMLSFLRTTIQSALRMGVRKTGQPPTPVAPVEPAPAPLHHVKHMESRRMCCQSAVPIDTCQSIRAVLDR
jgi:hypothetical protein